MTAPVPMKSKGTSVLQSISSVYTAIPGIVSIDKSGEEAETADIRTLDGAAGLPLAPTGFVKPPTISMTILYDAAHASHVALKTLMRTPVVTNFKVTTTDAGPLSEIWSVVGVGVDESYEGTKYAEAKVKLTCSGTAA